MKISCPVCQSSYDCDSRYYGKTFQCTRCGSVIAVPQAKPQHSIPPRQAPATQRFPEKMAVCAADREWTVYGALAATMGFVWVIVFVVSSIAIFAGGGALLGAKIHSGGFFVVLTGWAVLEVSVATLFASASAVFRIADCLCRLAGGKRMFGL